MSQNNVEIAERAVDAYNRRDVAAIDDLFIPEFEVSFTLVEGAADFAGVRAWKRTSSSRDTLPDLVLVAGQFRDLGDRSCGSGGLSDVEGAVVCRSMPHKRSSKIFAEARSRASARFSITGGVAGGGLFGVGVRCRCPATPASV